MKPTDKHFHHKDIQTSLKHTLLEDYIMRWANKIAPATFSKNFKELHFVDGFAGRGEFLDGQLGSPKIAIEKLFRLQEDFYQKYKSSDMRFYIHTVELNHEYQVELAKLKNSSRFQNQIINYGGKFEEHLPKILNRTNRSPALYFIDPYGYKGVRMQDIVQILSHRSHEVIINVMNRAIGRNLSIINNHDEIKDFFGIDQIPENIYKYIKISQNDSSLPQTNQELENLENSIVSLFKNQVRKIVKSNDLYLLSHRIYSSLNPNQYFHLVFITKRREGLIAMKESIVSYESRKPKIEDEFRYKNKRSTLVIDDFFSTSYQLNNYTYRDFRATFIDNFNKKTCSFETIVDFYLQHTPISFRDPLGGSKSIYDFFKILNKSGLITVSENSLANVDSHKSIMVHSNFNENNIVNQLEDFDNHEQMTLF